MADIKLTELIDVETLQQIQDGFSKLTGMAALAIDADGMAVTKGSNFTDFCVGFTKKSKEGCARCEKCDKDGGERAMLAKKPITYYCHTGLVEFVAPILLNGITIGSFIGGQVLTEAPDESKFRKIASELNIKPDDYVKAVKKVKIVEKSQIDDAAEYLFTITNLLSNIAYNNYYTEQSDSGLSSLNSTMFKKVQHAENVISESLKRMKSLSAAFETLIHTSEDSLKAARSTDETVKIIQDIALNTKILGFNASIEASRTKESGKGFGVIAQEVRSLAETSTNSAEKIQKTIKQISEHSRNINDSVVSTNHIIDACINNLNQFAVLLEEIKNMSAD